MSFSDRLKALRLQRGFTQEHLARTAGVVVATVARCEHAGVDPSWSTVVKLAEALGVPLDAFKDAPAVEPAAEASPAGKKPKRKIGD